MTGIYLVILNSNKISQNVVNLIKMHMRSLILIGLIATSMAAPMSFGDFFRQENLQGKAHDFNQWVQGFFFGMQVNEGKPDTCYKGTFALVADGGAIFQDILGISAGNATSSQQIYVDADKLSADFVANMPNCPVAGLQAALKGLTTTQGLTSAVYRAIDNIGSIKQDAAYISSCSTSPYACGKAIAEIAKIFLGWGI